MKLSSLAITAVLVVGLVLLGCTQPSPSPTATPAASEVPYGSGSDSTVASASPQASPAAEGGYVDDSTSQDLDSAGSDLDDLESLSDDLSAGDVQYEEAG